MPSVNGTRRRHTKQPSSSSKNTNPSLNPSTVSSKDLTALSAAQTPPRSIFSSSLRPPKRVGSRQAVPAQVVLAEGKASAENAKSIDPSNKENVNVFAFMEKDEEENDADAKEETVLRHDIHESRPSSPCSPAPIGPTPRSPKQQSPRYSDLEVRAIQDGVQCAWGRGSLHSDSGISLHSSSPDQDSPIMHHKFPMSGDIPRIEETGHEDNMPVDGLPMSPAFPSDRGSFSPRHWPPVDVNHGDVPEACQVASTQLLSQFAHSPTLTMPEMAGRPANELLQRRPMYDRSSPSSKSGYDLLASSITARRDAVLSPIYRKFEMLNNRMLLYLQDEISELEDDLRELDSAIAQEEANLGRGPSSRRCEARLPSQLQWHRLDLLARSFAKVEQYNRALTSYANLTKTLSPASHDSITAYREWIAQHKPIHERESDFLFPENEQDLVIITPPPAPSAAPPQTNLLDNRIVVLAFAFVSTIIVFKVVPRILARLVISGMVGLASLCTLAPKIPTSLGVLHEWKGGMCMYAAVMLVLAVVVN